MCFHVRNIPGGRWLIGRSTGMNRQVIRSPVARFLVAAGKLAPPVAKSALPSRGAEMPAAFVPRGNEASVLERRLARGKRRPFPGLIVVNLDERGRIPLPSGHRKTRRL